jgi:hypothetical protein
MSAKDDSQRPLDGFFDGLAESIADEDPVELLEEARAAGQNPGMIAEDLKRTLWHVLKKFEQRKLEAARESYRQHSASELTKNAHIAPTLDGRKRQLFTILESNPEIGAVLTTQHREFASLSDEDVESALADLAELGFLDDDPDSLSRE